MTHRSSTRRLWPSPWTPPGHRPVGFGCLEGTGRARRAYPRARTGLLAPPPRAPSGFCTGASPGQSLSTPLAKGPLRLTWGSKGATYTRALGRHPNPPGYSESAKPGNGHLPKRWRVSNVSEDSFCHRPSDTFISSGRGAHVLASGAQDAGLCLGQPPSDTFISLGRSAGLRLFSRASRAHRRRPNKANQAQNNMREQKSSKRNVGGVPPPKNGLRETCPTSPPPPAVPT